MSPHTNSTIELAATRPVLRAAFLRLMPSSGLCQAAVHELGCEPESPDGYSASRKVLGLLTQNTMPSPELLKLAFKELKLHHPDRHKSTSSSCSNWHNPAYRQNTDPCQILSALCARFVCSERVSLNALEVLRSMGITESHAPLTFSALEHASRSILVDASSADAALAELLRLIGKRRNFKLYWAHVESTYEPIRFFDWLSRQTP